MKFTTSVYQDKSEKFESAPLGDQAGTVALPSELLSSLPAPPSKVTKQRSIKVALEEKIKPKRRRNLARAAAS